MYGTYYAYTFSVAVPLQYNTVIDMACFEQTLNAAFWFEMNQAL